jgi:hypothetical protein
MQRKILIVILVAIAIALGFLRDYVFVFINYSIGAGHENAGKLSILKWVLTLLFSILYLINTCAVLFVLFQSKKYVRIAAWSYIFLFAISLLAAFCGYVFSSFENVYPFVRTIMGIAQSPVIMMILVPACFLDGKRLN